MRYMLGYFGRVPIERPDVLQAYASIDSMGETTGHLMGKNDVWIAAATYITGATLMTTDHDFAHLQPAFFPCEIIPLSSTL